MSGTALRAVIGFVLAFHGVGHAMGIIAALQLVNVEDSSADWLKGWSSHSWLLTELLGATASRILCLILYGAALVGFVAAALALMGWLVPHDWWRSLAVLSAVISLVGIALFWDALIMLFPHKIGAIGVNVAVLVGLLVANWPTEADLGY
jgi:hypothetical protein